MTLQEKASVILARAYQEALITPVPACSYSSFLDFVLDNNHLTYKYILFTALEGLNSGKRAGLFKKGSLEPPRAFSRVSISKGTMTL